MYKSTPIEHLKQYSIQYLGFLKQANNIPQNIEDKQT